MSTNPNSKLQSNGADFTPTLRHDTYRFIDPAQFDLEGRAVLITGASKGVGRAAALSFAKAGASYIGLGARSDMSDLEKEVYDTAKAASRKQPKLLILKLDVTNEDSVQNAASEVEKSFGRLDFLFNNAGWLEPYAPIGEHKLEWWWKVYETNVKSIFLVSRAFIPLMLKDGLKTIVNTSSIGAHLTTPHLSGYQSTKLAVIRFSEFLNADYGEQGLLAFSIHPGAVATELALGLPDAWHEVLTDKPELAGDAMVWLVAERRDWLAGRYISVNWDFNELLEKKQKIVQDDLLKVRLDVGLE